MKWLQNLDHNKQSAPSGLYSAVNCTCWRKKKTSSWFPDKLVMERWGIRNLEVQASATRWWGFETFKWNLSSRRKDELGCLNVVSLRAGSHKAPESSWYFCRRTSSPNFVSWPRKSRDTRWPSLSRSTCWHQLEPRCAYSGDRNVRVVRKVETEAGIVMVGITVGIMQERHFVKHLFDIFSECISQVVRGMVEVQCK